VELHPSTRRCLFPSTRPVRGATLRSMRSAGTVTSTPRGPRTRERARRSRCVLEGPRASPLLSSRPGWKRLGRGGPGTGMKGRAIEGADRCEPAPGAPNPRLVLSPPSVARFAGSLGRRSTSAVVRPTREFFPPRGQVACRVCQSLPCCRVSLGRYRDDGHEHQGARRRPAPTGPRSANEPTWP
jgi:hypothetical protein